MVNKFLPEVMLKNSTNKKIRIWSAASSSGEEGYTISMLLHEFMLQKPSWEPRILCSDIDTTIIEKARQGIYTEQNIQPIPLELLKKYFLKGSGKNSGLYRASDELKDIILFKQFNLLHDELPGNIKFDLIFLRNVLIYFQPDVIEIIINKMFNALNHSGYLFIGHSETLNNIKHNFRFVTSATYQKV